jgi:hypothetical protein
VRGRRRGLANPPTSQQSVIDVAGAATFGLGTGDRRPETPYQPLAAFI